MSTFLFELIQRLAFHVTFQGVVRSRAFLCTECAEKGSFAGHEDGSFGWRDSEASGANWHEVTWINKGYECVDDYTCPGCERDITGGEEVIFYLG